MCAGLLILVSLACTLGADGRYFTGRIIGGRDAEEEAYPYQASLRVGGVHNCGGSVIDQNWILTAGHCLTKHTADTIIVVVGTNSLLTGGVAYRVEYTVVHPDYASSIQANDIGLLKVRGPIKYTNAIAPIALPEEDVDDRGFKAVFTGWGNTKVGGTNHHELQEIDLNLIEISRCRKILANIKPTNICTLTVAGQGICYGDSGSPLVANGVQIGIGSWGSPCARGVPDVHTRVFSYIDWIKDVRSKVPGGS